MVVWMSFGNFQRTDDSSHVPDNGSWSITTDFSRVTFPKSVHVKADCICVGKSSDVVGFLGVLVLRKRGLACINFSFINSYQLLEVPYSFMYTPIL